MIYSNLLFMGLSLSQKNIPVLSWCTVLQVFFFLKLLNSIDLMTKVASLMS